MCRRARTFGQLAMVNAERSLNVISVVATECGLGPWTVLLYAREADLDVASGFGVCVCHMASKNFQ